MRRRTFLFAAAVLTAATFAGLNAFLVKSLIKERAARRVLLEAPQNGEIEAVPYHLYLIFSPAQCSSHFLPELKEWESVFEEFHGSRIWVEPVAVYTSEAELGRAWERLGFRIPVVIDPHGEILERLRLKAVPAKVLVGRAGEIAYKEEFPSLYEYDRLRNTLRTLLKGESQFATASHRGHTK